MAAEEQAISVTIDGYRDSFGLQQVYLGHKPFILLEWNYDTGLFDVHAGGGVPDLDAVTLVLGSQAELMGYEPDAEGR